MDPSEHGRRLFPGMNGNSGNGVDGGMERPHTLEEYSVDHFRPPPKRTMSKSLTISRYIHNKGIFLHVTEIFLNNNLTALERDAATICGATAAIQSGNRCSRNWPTRMSSGRRHASSSMR